MTRHATSILTLTETGPYNEYGDPILSDPIERMYADAFDDSDGEYPPPCINPAGHSWVIEDTEGHGEGRSYCCWCLADGDA